jgi:hypothetical protein
MAELKLKKLFGQKFDQKSRGAFDIKRFAIVS